MRTVAFLFQREAFCLEHEGKADNLWVVLLKQCVCLHEHTHKHARARTCIRVDRHHTPTMTTTSRSWWERNVILNALEKYFGYYYFHLGNGSIGKYMKFKRIFFLKSYPKLLLEWGEEWKESGKKRPQRMKRKTCKKNKKKLNQRVENKTQNTRTDLSWSLRWEFESAPLAPTLGCSLAAPDVCVLSVCLWLWRPQERLIIAPFPEMNLRYGRVNGFISSKRWSQSSSSQSGGWDGGFDGHLCLTGSVLHLLHLLPAGLPLIPCLPASASRSRGSEPLWQPGRDWKNQVVVSFPPTHKHTPLPVWLHFTWSSPFLKAPAAPAGQTPPLNPTHARKPPLTLKNVS